jgi:hypothetical protein
MSIQRERQALVFKPIVRQRSNILLFVSNQHRSDVLESLQGLAARTPALDQFADMGRLRTDQLF